jgi:predicted alpha/beta-fold hydrolase
MFRDSGLESNPSVRLLAPRHGGHSGFLAARPAGRDLDSYWGESRVVDFLGAIARKEAGT